MRNTMVGLESETNTCRGSTALCTTTVVRNRRTAPGWIALLGESFIHKLEKKKTPAMIMS